MENIVKADLSNFCYIGIREKNNNEYTFSLNENNEFGGQIILERLENGNYIEVYSGTIINSIRDVDVENGKQFKQNYDYYYDNPLFIKEYENVSEIRESDLDIQVANTIFLSELTSIAQQKLTEQYEIVKENNPEYKRNVKVKKLGGIKYE